MRLSSLVLTLWIAGCGSADPSATGDAAAGGTDGGTAGADSGAAGAGGGAAGSDSGAGGAEAGAAGAAGKGTVGPTITTFTPSGPIVVSSGQTIEGLHITTADGPCIRGNGVSNVHIVNNRIGPCGAGSEGIGISLEGGGSNIHVEHNAIDDVATGLYFVSNGDNIVFDHNYVTRVRGPMPRGQMVQFNTVSGTGNRVTCNISDQTTPGYEAGPEDHVSTFASSGTASSPLLVAYNKIRGGGPSTSGGGALAGDYDGEWVELRGNILINPGQYGLAIAGGRNHRILDNIVYAPDVFPWSNNGLFVWAQVGSGVCSGHEVRGNRVLYLNQEGVPNAGWNAGNCGSIDGWSDNVFTDNSLTLDVWNTVLPECA